MTTQSSTAPNPVTRARWCAVRHREQQVVILSSKRHYRFQAGIQKGVSLRSAEVMAPNSTARGSIAALVDGSSTAALDGASLVVGRRHEARSRRHEARSRRHEARSRVDGGSSMVIIDGAQVEDGARPRFSTTVPDRGARRRCSTAVLSAGARPPATRQRCSTTRASMPPSLMPCSLMPRTSMPRN